MDFPPAEPAGANLHLSHHYHIITGLSSCQVPKLLHFCYKSVTKVLRHHCFIFALYYKAPHSQITQPALYTVYILDKLEKLELASTPRDYTPQAGSWKLYTSWSCKKLDPPIFGPRQAATFGKLRGTTRPVASWNSVVVQIRGSAREINQIFDFYKNFMYNYYRKREKELVIMVTRTYYFPKNQIGRYLINYIYEHVGCSIGDIKRLSETLVVPMTFAAQDEVKIVKILERYDIA